ncbi:ABC-type dipeptide/oligopeptide/nickel transport system, permease component [Desulfosporosinus orientis DSM 765]|uniref:ABC-type dipeptide/oligopeptide/nickel transport system, permease component n=2 Tax=Desulfosporosinus orientis TaxID=1563 RepID=G7WDW5_DESOD|nr:ABC transporter permease [Desulfosporosinus orientis]AET68872.1 ABC-type dipeptide/oligopeptide/nickel transport system, permease component [Desulfosporosinus orientis DSM 765]
MIRYIILRILQLIPVLLGISMITFLMMSLIPGDPVAMILGQHISPQTMENIRQELGLDQPLLRQYFHYLWNTLHGDFGRSYIQHQEVSQMLLEKIPVTFCLALLALTIALTLGTLLGVMSAVMKNTVWDTFTTLLVSTGVSLPSFWLGMILQLIFGVVFHSLPVSGIGGEGFDLKYYILPATALGLASMALYARLTRACLLEVLEEDYIRTAYAKGLAKHAVIIKHALRNALIPIVTQAGTDFATLMGGAVLTETIFSLPGVGFMLFNAISRRDYPVVQGVTLFLALVFVVVNLIVDILYVFLDPRIRYE